MSSISSIFFFPCVIVHYISLVNDVYLSCTLSSSTSSEKISLDTKSRHSQLVTVQMKRLICQRGR